MHTSPLIAWRTLCKSDVQDTGSVVIISRPPLLMTMRKRRALGAHAAVGYLCCGRCDWRLQAPLLCKQVIPAPRLALERILAHCAEHGEARIERSIVLGHKHLPVIEMLGRYCSVHNSQ